MAVTSQIDAGVNSATNWDVPEILRRLVSLLTFCGLAVIGFIVLGGMVLYSDLSESGKLIGLAGAMTGTMICFWFVVRKVKTGKDLVADADYHKLGFISKFIEGSALRDFVEDRARAVIGASMPSIGNQPTAGTGEPSGVSDSDRGTVESIEGE